MESIGSLVHRLESVASSNPKITNKVLVVHDRIFYNISMKHPDETNPPSPDGPSHSDELSILESQSQTEEVKAKINEIKTKMRLGLINNE